MFCDSCHSFWSEALAKAKFPETIERPRDIVWTFCERTLHNSIRELKQASELRCRTCRLIASIPTEHEYATLFRNQNEPLHVVLTIGSRAGWGPFTLLHVEFRDAVSPHSVVLKRVLASCHGILTAEGAVAIWPWEPATCQHSADGLAQSIEKAVDLDNDHTGSDGALQLASYWIQSCINKHPRCRRTAPGDARTFMPTRLLEVVNNTIKLVDSEQVLQGRDRRYLALSHCWGPFPIIRTLRDNYEQHKQHIPPERLSKTFSQAIHVTRKLGFRYIWIDSMCIIQDDSSDWAVEAATMCDVYQNATFTIAAAHAPSGEVGCFEARDGLMHLPFHIQLPAAVTSDSIRGLHFRPIEQPQKEEPVLYTRAWVLQEQLLSHRMLIFDGVQLKWECLTMHGSEACPTDSKTRHDMDMKSVRRNLLHDFEYDEGEQLGSPRVWTRRKQMQWCELIMQYTHRRLTQSSDRLVALAGIAQALRRKTATEYLAGLWLHQFFLGLLWFLPHHLTSHMNPTTNFDVERDRRVRHKKDIAPSWSWASVTTSVSYDQDEMREADRCCQVRDVKVFGGANKQTGRAEIHGHVRTGYVNAVYPYLIHEATTQLPHMTAPAPMGNFRVRTMTFKKRAFNPNNHFLFSEQHPDYGDHLTTEGSFHFVRGAFRPDEIIQPTQEITFVAIAQRHFGERLVDGRISNEDHDPVRVQTLALVPTGDNEGTYRRVGLAVWNDCSWYGYLCGWGDLDTEGVKDPQERAQKHQVDWEERYRPTWWDDLEFYEFNKYVGDDDQDGRWEHKHEYEKDHLPSLGMYHPETQVEERTMIII